MVLSSAQLASAEPVKIRIGYVTQIGQLTPLIFHLDNSVLKHHGKSFKVESIHFKGTSPEIQAMAAGVLEIGYLAFSSFANAVVNANLPVRVIHDNFQDGVPGTHSMTWYVLEDSGINTVKDLRGKTAAINVAGAGVDLFLRAILKKNGLRPKKDVNIVEVRFPNQETMLREKKIHAAVLISTFLSRAMKRGGLRPLFTGQEAVGKTQFLFGVVMEDFLKKNEAALADFLEDYLRGLAWFQKPANRDKALDLASRVTKIPRKKLVDWAFIKELDYYRVPDGEPDLDTLQKNIDLLAEMKFIKRSFNVKAYAGLGPLRIAQRRFKASK